jgi:hypothetical protein
MKIFALVGTPLLVAGAVATPIVLVHQNNVKKAQTEDSSNVT